MLANCYRAGRRDESPSGLPDFRMDEWQRPLHFPFIAPLSFGSALMLASHFGGLGVIHGALVFRMRLGGDFGAEPPQSEGSGGKAFCGTKRFLWHKNTPCRAPE